MQKLANHAGRQPFKVVIRFLSPVIIESEYPIHLDALLAWAEADDARAAGSNTPWDDANDLSIVLDNDGEGAQMVWKASRLIFTPLRERNHLNMIRKSDPEAFLQDYDAGYFRTPRAHLNSIDTRSGQYRAYQMLVAYQWMEKAEAWGVGDIEEVREKLSRLRHIGKMGRNGFGLIASIDVEPCAEATDKWKIRVLPEGRQGATGIRYAPALHCLRAPYWRKTDRIVAMEPVL